MKHIQVSFFFFLYDQQPPPLVYLLSFAQFLDIYGIMIMWFDPIDTQQLSQDSLILPLNLYVKNIKTGLFKTFISFWL